jgi:hypothetical protein
MKWIEVWAKGDGNRELDVLRDEGKDKCEHALIFLIYTNPQQCNIICSTMLNLAMSPYL